MEEKEINSAPKKENAPLSFFQRLAYTIIDFGLIAMTFFGLYQLALITPISSNLHKAEAEMVEIQIEIGTSTGYFVKTYLEPGQTTNYKKYEDEGGVYYYLPDDNFKKVYLETLNDDVTYGDLKFNYTVNSFAIALSTLFIAESFFLFGVPLMNKRRGTLGIIFAGGQAISKKYVSRARWYQMLGRFGIIYVISAGLYFAAGETLLLIIPVITLIISSINKDRRSLHDLITGVKIIDRMTFVPLVDHDAVDAEPEKVE